MSRCHPWSLPWVAVITGHGRSYRWTSGETNDDPWFRSVWNLQQFIQNLGPTLVDDLNHWRTSTESILHCPASSPATSWWCLALSGVILSPMSWDIILHHLSISFIVVSLNTWHVYGHLVIFHINDRSRNWQGFRQQPFICGGWCSGISWELQKLY